MSSRDNSDSEVFNTREVMKSSKEQSTAAMDKQESGVAASMGKVSSVEHGMLETMPRRFTMLSAIGIGAGITNSAIGALLVLPSATPSGGAPLYFWGWFLVALIGLCNACSLAELASAYPHPGGQYYWTAQLAPASSRRVLSYVTAIVSWLGALLTCASATLSMPSIAATMIHFSYPDLIAEPWHVYLGYVAFTVLSFGFNCFQRTLPHIGRTVLIFTMCALFVVFVALLAASPTKMTAQDFFLNLTNSTGWPDGVAFLIGLNGLNWCFSCLDAAVHLADEIPAPERNIPKVLMATIVVGFVSGMMIIVAAFLSSPDPANNVSLMSIALVAINGSSAAALAFQSFIIISTGLAVIGIHTWQSRLAWSFSRHGGFPFSKWQARVAPAPFETPIAAHAWSCLWVIALGAIYLGSEVAFSSLVSASLLYQYLSISIPVVLLLMKGRDKLPRGPFWLGRWGAVCNIVTVVWFVCATVIYSLPYYYPVEADSMNYTAPVFVGLMVLIVINWFAYGRSRYHVEDDLGE